MQHAHVARNVQHARCGMTWLAPYVPSAPQRSRIAVTAPLGLVG